SVPSTSLLHSTSPAAGSYPLSLHDALPIFRCLLIFQISLHRRQFDPALFSQTIQDRAKSVGHLHGSDTRPAGALAVCFQIIKERSEEHTSELQSRFDLVCRLLLEKKKNKRS